MTQHRPALAGIEARTLVSDRSFPRHSHDQFGIGVMLCGGHRSWSSVGQVEAQAGDAIMVNPGEIHDGMPVGGSPRTWRMLYFDPPLVLDALAEEECATDIQMRPAVRDPLLAVRFGELFAAVTRSRRDDLQIEQDLLRTVMHVRQRHAVPVPARPLPSPAVAKALERLDADPASPVSLAELATLAGVSRFQLIRGFVRHAGITPHAYLVQRRVRLARALLARGEPPASVAVSAGFADQSHMTRAFVRQFGVTPARFVAALA